MRYKSDLKPPNSVETFEKIEKIRNPFDFISFETTENIQKLFSQMIDILKTEDFTEELKKFKVSMDYFDGAEQYFFCIY